MSVHGGSGSVTAASSTRVEFDLSPREIVASLIIRIQNPEDCYEESDIGRELIPALAALRDHEIDGYGFTLKKKFPKDFSFARNQRWWGSIKAHRETLRQASRIETPCQLTPNGNYVANLFNAKIFLRRLPLAFNEFTGRSFLTGKSPWGSSGNWTDHDDTMATEWLQGQGIQVSIQTAYAAAESVARERMPHIHPIRDYLSCLTWDGVERCPAFLERCFGADDDETTAKISTTWLIAAVKRVFEPGCQSDYTLVLEGVQGPGKSTALRTLAVRDEWFLSNIRDIGKVDAAIQLQGKWIVELGELAAIRGRENETVKAWLTERYDNFRSPYGRRADDHARHCIFAATTNRGDWLTDETGGRRFWPVAITRIDRELIRERRDLIWAEAVHRYRAGELTYFDDESELRDRQADRQSGDVWDDIVMGWVENPIFASAGMPGRSRPGRIYLAEILWHAIRKPEKEQTHGDKQRIGSILRRHGYTPRRPSRSDADESGRRPEYWDRS